MTDRSELLDALTRFAHSMAVDYDVGDVLYRLTDEVTAVLAVAGAGISVADPDGRLRYAAASDDVVIELERVQERTQVGPCATAFRTQEPVLVTDVATRVDWPDYRDVAIAQGACSVMGIPLGLGGERFGAVNIYDHDPREWTQEELVSARVLGDMAAGYLLRASLEESRRLADQLQEALSTRIVIEQAKGLVAGALGIDVDRAFTVLRDHARANNATLRVVAQAVVEDGFRPDLPPARVHQP